MAEQESILEAQGLTKEFKGFVAVKNVDLRVRRHTIHALIGPNGAGKTTCFNLLTHFLTPTAGRIHFNGRDITGSSPAAIARMGLARSFQISAVFPHLSVRENVRVALQRRLGISFQFWRSESVLRDLDGRALELVEAVGLSAFAELPAVELPYGRKRALEIATYLIAVIGQGLALAGAAGTRSQLDRLTAGGAGLVALRSADPGPHPDFRAELTAGDHGTGAAGVAVGGGAGWTTATFTPAPWGNNNGPNGISCCTMAR